MSLLGPTWGEIAGNHMPIEVRVVKGYQCPFCDRTHRAKDRKSYTGFRCYCGALFHTSQAYANHYLERDKHGA
jgi:hypothetical protein